VCTDLIELIYEFPPPPPSWNSSQVVRQRDTTSGHPYISRAICHAAEARDIEGRYPCSLVVSIVFGVRVLYITDQEVCFSGDCRGSACTPQ